MTNAPDKLPNSAKELRLLYNVSKPTWSAWLDAIRDQVRPNAKIYTPKEIKAITTHLGEP